MNIKEHLFTTLVDNLESSIVLFGLCLSVSLTSLTNDIVFETKFKNSLQKLADIKLIYINE